MTNTYILNDILNGPDMPTHTVDVWFSYEWDGPDYEITCEHDENGLAWDDLDRDCRLSVEDPDFSCGVQHWQDAGGMESIGVRKREGASAMFPLHTTAVWGPNEGHPILVIA